MAAESLRNALWERSPGVGARWRQRILGGRSVEEEAAVARSWDEVATESLGSFLWGRRLRRQELGRGGDREPWERQRALGTLRG